MNTNDLAGMLLLNDANVSPEEASVILNKAPVLRSLYCQAASQGGTRHQFKRKLTAPGVGFRLINEGITNAGGTFEIVSQDCALLDASFDRDKALAMAFKKGATAYMDAEGMDSLQEAFFAAECAIFRAGMNKQFTGLPGNPYFDQVTADSQVIDAGGSGGRSVWLLRSAANGISVIAGNEGRIDMATTDTENRIKDASNRFFTALSRSILGFFCLQVGRKYDAVRIVNLDGTTGHTLTDDMLYDAISRFPSGEGPNMIALSRTSLKELRQSRTATNPTGSPAPTPKDVDGIQIINTDAIPENEAAINTTTTTTTTSTQA
jgi:hypothetical protein